LKSWFSCQKE